MNNSPSWLPALEPLGNYNGDWNVYLAAIYAIFKNDFVDDKPVFQGRRLALKRYPITNGKEATFWHFIQKGKVEEDRVPDFRRCERIRWPRPVIEHDSDDSVKIWWNRRGRERRICLWVESEEYLVVLTDRSTYVLPWTAYLVVRSHQKKKLQREYEEYWNGRS